MISKITGMLSYKGTDRILIDVHGIGYEVFLADSTLAKTPSCGKKISVYTELIVREDLMQLVGFSTQNEREWYRLLTGVQGVGSKAALKILGTLQISILSRSILNGDVDVIKSAPSIGPKIAQRIITELKDKASTIMRLGYNEELVEPFGEIPVLSNIDLQPSDIDSSGDVMGEVGRSLESSSSLVQSEALSALINLGYTSYDAALAINSALDDQNTIVELNELIKLALQNLLPKA